MVRNSTFQKRKMRPFQGFLERVSLGYSVKNIPIPSKSEYFKLFVLKQEAFARRLRWKAFFALDPNAKESNIKTFGFKSTKTPPLPNHPLKSKIRAFEEEFFSMVRKIQFRRHDNEFQRTLREDIKKNQNWRESNW